MRGTELTDPIEVTTQLSLTEEGELRLTIPLPAPEGTTATHMDFNRAAAREMAERFFDFARTGRVRKL